MSKFLKEVAQFLFSQKDSDISDYTIVFPNRRAGLFFQRYLGDVIETPIFSPRILTISEIISEISCLKLAEQNVLVVELYKIFQKVTQTTESLDDFFYWGEMLLTDFNDIDKYLVESEQLFSNIKSLKEIDDGFSFLTEEQIKFLSTFWDNVLTAQDSDNKQQFLRIWESLMKIYTEFQQVLVNKGWAYEGLLYRQMVDNLEDSVFLQSGKFVFVGFNALNKCEKSLFTFLRNNKNGSYFWDYDTYYKNAPFHEAALFIDDNLVNFPMPKEFDVEIDNFSNLKEIDVVSIPGFSGQASYASNWITQNSDNVSARFDNTAIVMCDETLLLPMLSTMPAGVNEFNITMGFPVKSSPAYALIKALIDVDRMGRPDKEGVRIYYYRHVFALLSNPLIKELLGDWYNAFIIDVRAQNKIYLMEKDFEANEILNQIFSFPDDASLCKDYFQNILKIVFEKSSDENSLLKESLYQLHNSLSRLHDVVFEDAAIGELYSKKLFYQLLLRQLDRINIPFDGEPLCGVQLMGFLETRCLDFDNLILLSFNDDKLPGKSHQHSFIPYSLRRGFGLPVIEQKNAMYAYYFYRLIQRSKKVTLVYDSRSDGMSGGEASRFLTQLKYEAKHLELKTKQGVFNFEPSDILPIDITKSELVLNEVKSYLKEKRVSPSALSVYLDCKLKFYFKYIERIKEVEDLLEDIDHLVFGRVAHLALEELYKPFEGKQISKDELRQLKRNEKKLNMALNKALESEYFKNGNFQLNGRNLLVYDIIRKYVLRIINHDIDTAPFLLIGLEKSFENKIVVDAGDEVIAVKFGGFIDRLDQVGDTVRVVDYKTGISENKVVSIAKLFEPGKSRNKAAFQTMVYANCVNANRSDNLPIVPAVYGARNIFTESFQPEFQINGGSLIYQANADEFESGLKALIEEMLSTETTFSQVDDAKSCSFCEFKTICNK